MSVERAVIVLFIVVTYSLFNAVSHDYDEYLAPYNSFHPLSELPSLVIQ